MTVIRVKGNERARCTTSRSCRPALVQAHDETGLLIKLRVCEFYEKPTAGRERNKAAAVKRHFKRLRSQMLPKKFY